MLCPLTVHLTNVLLLIAAIRVARCVGEDDPETKVATRIPLEPIAHHVELASHVRPEKRIHFPQNLHKMDNKQNISATHAKFLLELFTMKTHYGSLIFLPLTQAREILIYSPDTDCHKLSCNFDSATGHDDASHDHAIKYCEHVLSKIPIKWSIRAFAESVAKICNSHVDRRLRVTMKIRGPILLLLALTQVLF